MNDVDLRDVIEVLKQQLLNALSDSAMNAALAMKRQRRVEELEALLLKARGEE